jgi:DNA-directed RNA polymerase subunit RPC12/RpoP
MPEFKFSCPQCGQNIQCDDSYAGAQINCPSCNQAIIVPQAQSAYTAPPATPPPGPGSRIPAAGQRFAAAQMPVPQKSSALRNTLVTVVVVIVLAALGVGAWVGYSKYEAKQALKKGNPAAMVATPSASQTTSAMDLLSKVKNTYTNLTSLSLSGTSVMALDLSQMTMADMDPKAKNTRRGNIPKAITNTMEVSLKLERPGMYCLQSKGSTKMGRMSTTNTMAAWSLGETNYSFMAMGGGAYKRYAIVPDRNTALMSGGQPSVLALTIMGFFFSDVNTNMQKIIQDWGQTEDDSVDGQDCSTVTAKLFGQKWKLWISKDNYMILQSQLTLGAPVNDEDIDSALDAFDTSTNQEQIAKDKAQAKQQMQMMTKIRGTITDTYDDVESNPTLTEDDFNYQVPRGVRLARQF